ncbi:hypothetical protein [Saccharibacter floricola]|uniref:Uncharacterized protein n=1 Tax=Saccharibacter floricola DSM 15669 TaxID=1123227 RepID=A0ABQ0NXX5_9PROT|nr:hypothetical protein [Saccharibacter floricola]GBQ05898.1 hypothetical protein AA15669_0689 [Saccharibacter floricola DSM 15669]
MLLENSQTIIEVILTLVIVAGIISSRRIVKRLGVIRETYAALNEMVANLDTSTEHVGRLFDAMKMEANKGGKRLNTLVEHARNAGEDLTDLQKMVSEVSAQLEQDVTKADKRQAALEEAILKAQRAADLLEKRLASYRDIPSAETLKAQYEQKMKEVEETMKKAFMPMSPQVGGDSLTVSFHPEIFDPKQDTSPSLKEEPSVYSSNFYDNFERPMPHSMRSPRPYMKAVDEKK